MRKFKDNLYALPHSSEAREILKDPEKRKILYERIKEERSENKKKSVNDKKNKNNKKNKKKLNAISVKREIVIPK